MSQGMITDVRSLVLESEEFGPSQVETIRELLANDLAAVRQLREVAQILRDRLKKATGTTKRELSKRLGIVEYLLGRSTTAQYYLLNTGNDPFALEYLGKAFLAREQYHEAAEAFAAAAKAGADPVLMALYEAGAHRLAGDLDKAKKLIKSVEKKAQDLAEYHYQKGCILAEEGDRMEALAEFERALTIDSHHPEALFQAAYIYDLYGADDVAQEYYERCISRAPVHMGALINLGVLYEDKGEYVRAARCFRRVLSIYPTNVRARLFYRDAMAEQESETATDEERPKTLDRMQQLLAKPVYELELSVRARNCLENLGIKTLGDLVSYTEEELIQAKNFGDTSLQEIKEVLRRYNLRLGMLPKKPAEAELPGVDPEVLKQPIDTLKLSGRARRGLDKLNIQTVGDLIQRTPEELLAVKNFGKTSLKEVESALERLGLSLKRSK